MRKLAAENYKKNERWNAVATRPITTETAMKAFKARFTLIDCGRVSRRTRGSMFQVFSEAGTWPFVTRS
jgi:hypothetical protein